MIVPLPDYCGTLLNIHIKVLAVSTLAHARLWINGSYHYSQSTTSGFNQPRIEFQFKYDNMEELLYYPFYIKDLVHPQILVSPGNLEPVPPQISRKDYHHIFLETKREKNTLQLSFLFITLIPKLDKDIMRNR